MKLLIDNILSTATLSSLHEDENNPLENLYAVFLRNRYQSTETDDEITIEFDEETTINSFFYAFTNATLLNIRFLDEDGLETLEIGDADFLTTEDDYGLTTEDGDDLMAYSYSETPEDIESFHFSPVAVKKIIITLAGDENVYLGGVGVGTTYAPPSFSDVWTEPFDDRSIVSESQAGQSLQEYVEPLRQYAFSFEMLTRTELNALRQKYTSLGRGRPIWIEILSDHDEIKPLFGKIEEVPGTNRNRNLLSMTFTFKEAR